MLRIEEPHDQVEAEAIMIAFQRMASEASRLRQRLFALEMQRGEGLDLWSVHVYRYARETAAQLNLVLNGQSRQ